MSAMPGVKCVWSEEHKCLLKEDAEERMTQKVINAGSLSVAECQQHDAGKWQMGGVTREKVPYGLSRCHTKRRMGACGRAHHSIVRPMIKKNCKRKKN